MHRKALRNISWIKGALKEFGRFPDDAQDQATDALTAIAEGDTPEIVKPMTGLGSGMWELAIKERGDAFRVIYALQLDDDIWVVHAFQKKSKQGKATPQADMDLIRTRLKSAEEHHRQHQTPRGTA